MQGIGTYISHMDTSVRRCGMLTAEIIATMTNKKLSFGDWDGDDSGKPWCRQMRELIQDRDVDADLSVLGADSSSSVVEPVITITSDNSTLAAELPETPTMKATLITSETGYDSDDSLIGYASPDSSRSASPTPSELEEIEKDPTLVVGIKKVPRPVYLAQLGDLIRGTGPKLGKDEPHECDKIEMALKYGEELIRKKRDYGTELGQRFLSLESFMDSCEITAENAVNLVHGFLVLHDNFNSPGFDEKRQGAMNALIACAPRIASPFVSLFFLSGITPASLTFSHSALIEEFFKNQYSVDQRHVALTALAAGARELAHEAIDRKETTEDKSPQMIREKRLKIAKAPAIVEVTSSSSSRGALTSLRSSTALSSSKRRTTFTEVAAEFFIGPLINRFWLFLRDEQMREERTTQRTGRSRYHGAGTGLILNPLVLSQFLRTLAILVNAAQNAPEWLAILGPDSLELAVTIGTRPISSMEIEDVPPHSSSGDGEGKDAAVLVAALELALIVLDGCLELDGGKSLGLDHTNLILGVGEWAGAVFSNLEKGLRVVGGGGLHEMKLQRAAAGLLVKVDELRSRWSRSMIDTR